MWENLGLVDFLALQYGAAAPLQMVAARFEFCEEKRWMRKTSFGRGSGSTIDSIGLIG